MFKIRRVLKLRVAISFFTFDYVNLLMKIHFVLIGTFLLLKIRKKSLTQNYDQNSIKKISKKRNGKMQIKIVMECKQKKNETKPNTMYFFLTWATFFAISFIT